MQGLSKWTWRRWDGSEYPAGRIPSFWRRVADRSQQEAQRDFGPLADYQELIRDVDKREGGRRGADSAGPRAAARHDWGDWEILHYRLKAVAKLWKPSATDAGVFELDRFDLQRNPDAAALRATLDMAIADDELLLRLEGWHLVTVPMSLRGLLLLGAVVDIAAAQRHRRCDQCNEWFPLRRNDQKFCGGKCRLQAHIAGRAEE